MSYGKGTPPVNRSQDNLPQTGDHLAGQHKGLTGSYNSGKQQRQRLLDYLIEHGTITTVEARHSDVLDILYPPSRISELRDAEHDIPLSWQVQETAPGKPHRVGRYTLITVNYHRLTSGQAKAATAKGYQQNPLATPCCKVTKQRGK